MLEHLIALMMHPDEHVCAWRAGELYIVPLQTREVGTESAADSAVSGAAAAGARPPPDHAADVNHGEVFGAYSFTPSSSTSKISVALGGIEAPAPRVP